MPILGKNSTISTSNNTTTLQQKTSLIKTLTKQWLTSPVTPPFPASPPLTLSSPFSTLFSKNCKAPPTISTTKCTNWWKTKPWTSSVKCFPPNIHNSTPGSKTSLRRFWISTERTLKHTWTPCLTASCFISTQMMWVTWLATSASQWVRNNPKRQSKTHLSMSWERESMPTTS